MHMSSKNMFTAAYFPSLVGICNPDYIYYVRKIFKYNRTRSAPPKANQIL